MQHVYVRALPDRVAFSAPSGGKRIPNDHFILIPLTPWVRRLITEHGDIEFRQPDENGDLPEVARPAAPSNADSESKPVARSRKAESTNQ